MSLEVPPLAQVCESCLLHIRGRIPGVREVSVTVKFFRDATSTEIVTLQVHDTPECINHIPVIINRLITFGIQA